MKINKLQINNFYSFKKVELSFDEFDGVVLIEGENKDTGGSNGSGKSAVIEAIVWALFGKTIRKSTEDALINNQAKKKCEVKIIVNDNVVIERGKRPTYLKLYVNGEERTQQNATATQRLIEEVLKTNYKVFLASTVFGQMNEIDFVNATPDDRRTIIKNFLNLDDIFNLRDSVKRLKSEFSSNIKRMDAIIDDNRKTLTKFEKQLKLVSNLQEGFDKIGIDLDCDYSLEELVEQEKTNNQASWRLSSIENELDEHHRKIAVLKKQLDSPTKTKCSECGQAIEGKAHPKHTMMKIGESQNKIESLEEERASVMQNIVKLPITAADYGKVLEYKTLMTEQDTYTQLKADTLQKISECEDEKRKYNNQYEIMRFWEKAFSESGIVKYVIKNVLEYFNTKSNYYLSYLSQGKFFIEFDEQLKETITHNNKEVHYISLSGGEKKKVNLAVMLALQELLKLSHSEESSIMFFDEVAEFLDDDGIEGLYILLQELKKTKKLFVITHNNYLKSLTDNSKTLAIIKQKGISKFKVK